MIYVEVRGTTILVSLSYFAFQSFTRFLGSVNAIVDDTRPWSYFGTATSRVSIYSES